MRRLLLGKEAAPPAPAPRAASFKKVFIVEDHVVVRDGYTMAINEEKDLRVCGEAGSAGICRSDHTSPCSVMAFLVVGGRCRV